MIQIFINGEEIVCDKKFTIKEQLLSTSSTILNNCYPKRWEDNHDYTSNFYFPKDYSNCEIYDNGVLIFAGVVKNSGNISLKPTDPKYCSLQILDYKTLLSEGETLDFVINDKTINEAIQMVIDAVESYGFVRGNIDIESGDEVIGVYSTLNKTPYDVFQYLSEISQSKWFTRMIDKDTIAIDFYDPDKLPIANDIEYTKEYFENNHIVDITFNYNTNDYRNKQTILSDLVYGNIDSDETLISNGYQETYEISEIIGTLKNVYVNNVSKTIATTTEKGMGIYADFYYAPGETRFEASTIYPANTVIRAIYIPLVKGRQVVYNNNEVTRISNQTNRNGIIARYESRNDILSIDELTKTAQSYIKYKGSAEIVLTIKTEGVDLFEIGQQVYFDMPDIQQLATNYMVKTKDTEITKTGNEGIVFYTYTLSSNYNSETSINYFDNQRRKASGNITEGQFITRNIDIENQANIIFENLTITEVEIVGDNILNSVLNSPFVE